ncbi:hypothetical protein HPB50_024892 [Hyalomma asiaticum]|uniref:Uncharacterized protein n=1 Tax=Hyalomma asiaticum TaxID=266040 RepID=A0ACB7SBS2_HYAAI|nr:hypothetical protein HPB50_024892 [Hyalomma asiaticum]
MRTQELVSGAVFAVAAAASFLVLDVTAAPRCENTSRPMQASYTCVGFTSTRHLAEHVQRSLLTENPLTLVLSDCELPELPTFDDIPVHVLELSNVTVKSFGSDGTSAPLVAGVEKTLEKLVLRDRSSLPASLSSLKNLKTLKVLRFFNMAALQLTTDYNELAGSLNVVEVVQSSIERIDEEWLARVTGLESLVVRDCNLKHFQRSMLPRPAPSLWNLDLVGNNLTSLPDDFGEDYPALKFLDLGSNSLATVSKASLAPLLDSPIEAVELGGNPLVCNCSVEHLRAFPVELLSADCWEPESLRRRNVQELTDEDLQCA